jgi:hypothetical protein
MGQEDFIEIEIPEIGSDVLERLDQKSLLGNLGPAEQNQLGEFLKDGVTALLTQSGYECNVVERETPVLPTTRRVTGIGTDKEGNITSIKFLKIRPALRDSAIDFLELVTAAALAICFGPLKIIVGGTLGVIGILRNVLRSRDVLDIESDGDELRVFLAIGKIIIEKSSPPLASVDELAKHLLGTYTENEIKQILKTLTARELVTEKEVDDVKGVTYACARISDIDGHVSSTG